jgi:hypothetical protein
MRHRVWLESAASKQTTTAPRDTLINCRCRSPILQQPAQVWYKTCEECSGRAPSGQGVLASRPGSFRFPAGSESAQADVVAAGHSGAILIAGWRDNEMPLASRQDHFTMEDDGQGSGARDPETKRGAVGLRRWWRPCVGAAGRGRRCASAHDDCLAGAGATNDADLASRRLGV